MIQDALCRCFEITGYHEKICCMVSGGADSDVMIDMVIRVGAKDKTDFVFFDTGLEYAATKAHLVSLEDKYDIKIQRIRPDKPIPICVKEYGVPFWGKYASEMIERLQSHGFKFEDKPFDKLMNEYDGCKTALRWWCNDSTCNIYRIDRSPYLKEFLIENPPQFNISDKCCYYAKKKMSKQIESGNNYDLMCVGVRKSEGGVRASIKTCFDSRDGLADHFRPVFWFSNNDKDEYCKHYGIVHSDCYTKYGLSRTGCVGCPFAKGYKKELSTIHLHEPKLEIAANNIFGKAYQYTEEYMKFRERHGCSVSQ